MTPTLYIVIPCYNEEAVLPVTAPLFLQQLTALQQADLVSERSRILLVDDGSRDSTWDIISALATENSVITGVSLSRNRGHQNALLAGLMESKDRCDITISIDCDGQDDPAAMEQMVRAYLDGCEVVYGVRRSRKSDSVFKRGTARGFYRLLRLMGVDVVYDHADYRLLSAKALQALAEFQEVNLFLRGMIPLVGFKSTSVYYDRHQRLAGKTHYPLRKMLHLAFDGITSLSTKPLRMISTLGVVMALISLLGILWALIAGGLGQTMDNWVYIAVVVCLLGSIQLICLGVIGEYIGKLYLEVKHRPRWIIGARTEDEE